MGERPQPEQEVERALTELGALLDYPEARGLARAVRSKLEQAPPSRIARFRWSLPHGSVATTAAVIVVALAAGMILVSPTARSAVADLLGLEGVRIRYGQSPPAPVNPSPDLDLGIVVTLAEANARASFKAKVPSLAELGQADQVYFSDRTPGGQIALLYRPRPGLPRTANENVGLLLTEFRGQVRQEFMAKVVGSGTRMEQVTVDGASGIWLEGSPHFFFYLDPDGKVRQETIRLAGNTLLWEKDSLTFRLESALSKDEALRLATHVR